MAKMNKYQLVLRENARPVDVRYWRSSSINNIRARAVKEFSKVMFYGESTDYLQVNLMKDGEKYPLGVGNIYKSPDGRLWWSAYVDGRYQKYWINKDGTITKMGYRRE